MYVKGSPTLLDIVLPCLDEAAALPWVLGRIPSGARAVVVDNGSTDASAATAEAYGATVVRCEQRGYGAACHAGLVAATAPFVAFCDCDGTLDPADAARMMSVLQIGADLAVARRRPTTRSAMSLGNRIANRELARRVRQRTALPLHDIGPLRVARREALLQLGIADRRSGYPVETVVRAADADWRVVSVDVDYRERIGRSKVTGTFRGTWQAVRDMSQVLAA